MGRVDGTWGISQAAFPREPRDNAKRYQCDECVPQFTGFKDQAKGKYTRSISYWREAINGDYENELQVDDLFTEDLSIVKEWRRQK